MYENLICQDYIFLPHMKEQQQGQYSEEFLSFPVISALRFSDRILQGGHARMATRSENRS